MPFEYYDLGPSRPAAATQNGADVYIRPAPGRYAMIKVRLLNKVASSSDNDNESLGEWTLLVDTACSGLVLLPNVVRQANDGYSNAIRIANNLGTGPWCVRRRGDDFCGR